MALFNVSLGRIAALDLGRVGLVVAADVDRRALHRVQLAHDGLLAPPAPRPGRRRRRPARRRRSARPAPGPSTARGRSGCRGCRARRPCATGDLFSSRNVPVARSSVSASTWPRRCRSSSASISSDARQREELAERIPAQVVLLDELLHVLGRRTAGAGLEQAAAVHQRHDREHLGAGAQLEDREQVGQVVAQHVAGDRDRVLAACGCAPA